VENLIWCSPDKKDKKMKTKLFFSRKRPFDQVVIEFSTCKIGGDIPRTNPYYNSG